jgi:hypothetical protein
MACRGRMFHALIRQPVTEVSEAPTTRSYPQPRFSRAIRTTRASSALVCGRVFSNRKILRKDGLLEMWL